MNNMFQNVGLFLCVGGIIVLALVAVAVAAFVRRSRTNQQQPPSVLNQRGHEIPTYDSQRVESHGGFGSGSDTPTNDRPIPQTGRRSGGFGGARQFDSDPNADSNRPQTNEDDDTTKSSGGFGG